MTLSSRSWTTWRHRGRLRVQTLTTVLPNPFRNKTIRCGGRSADVLLRGLGTYVTGCDRRTATYLAVGGYSSPPTARPAVPGFGRSLLD